MARHLRELKRGLTGGDLVSGEISGQRKEMMTWPGRQGPLLVREGEDRLYQFGVGSGGLWA
jgi:hypothetical protein